MGQSCFIMFHRTSSQQCYDQYVSTFLNGSIFSIFLFFLAVFSDTKLEAKLFQEPAMTKGVLSK